MKVRLFHRLLLAFVGVAVATLVTAGLLWRWQFSAGFLDYVNRLERTDVERVVDVLSDRYAQRGDWSFLRGPGRRNRGWEQAWLIVRGVAPPPPAPPAPRGPGRDRPRNDRGNGDGRSPRRPPPAALPAAPAAVMTEPAGAPPIETRVALYAPDGRKLAGPELPAADHESTPVRHGETIVGELRRIPLNEIPAGLETDFVRNQARAVLLSVAGVQLLAILAAWLLARQLAQPVRHLAAGTRVLARGDYEHRMVLDRSDEVGDLSRDLDQLARRLAAAERARREWMADIAHELRTPLTVLQGEIEAMVDGVRETTTQRVGALRSEVLCLGRLVDDLHTLALSDAGALDYRLQPLALLPLVEHAIGAFQTDAADANLTLELTDARVDPVVDGDADRLLQLLNNLLTNALRYTDPGGRIEVRVRREGGRVSVIIDDSAPGLSARDRERLGTPLFRPDPARSRRHGGSGLGLAIAARIASAHGGGLAFEASALGGLRVTIDLPEHR